MLAQPHDGTQNPASPPDRELDRGPRSGPASARLCALTRVSKPTADMIRFVRSPQGDVVPDVKHKLPGRGLWITATRQALEDSVKRNVFARGFKAQLQPPLGLAAQTDDLLARAALDALAIAGKAGLALHGYAKVETAIERGQAVAVIQAADGADDGKRKINAYLRGRGLEIPVIQAFTSAQLDLALGRSNVVHAALLAGSATNTFMARALRLVRFRAPDENPFEAPRADA
jgi:predicted RNA-binding protein YlxR (DUF448 family)